MNLFTESVTTGFCAIRPINQPCELRTIKSARRNPYHIQINLEIQMKMFER